MHKTPTSTPGLRRREVMATALATAATSLLGGTAHAQQDFPSRPISVVVPFAPGGPDRVLRFIGEKLQASMKQPVVIDNRPGATGLIGSRYVQQAKPDGHTLLFTSNSTMVIAPLLRQPPTFDASKDFTPLTLVMRYPMFVLVPPSHPAKTLAEFVAMAKARPNALNFASNGAGSMGHLALELFARSAGITMTHVAYKGLGEVQTAIMSGEVQLSTDGPLSISELLRAGKVRALAVTGDKRIAAFPNVPTMKELGYPEVDVQVWLAFFAPKGTPEPIVRKLSEEIGRAIQAEDVHQQIVQGGLAEAVSSTPQELARLIEAETPAFKQLVKQLNIRID